MAAFVDDPVGLLRSFHSPPLSMEEFAAPRSYASVTGTRRVQRCQLSADQHSDYAPTLRFAPVEVWRRTGRSF